MENRLRKIYNEILTEYGVEKEKCGLWILEGKVNDSFLAVGEELEGYQLFFYLEKKMTKMEWWVFFHEIGHILTIEEMLKKESKKAVMEVIRKEEEEVGKIDKEKNRKKRQKLYRDLELEKKADDWAKRLILEWGEGKNSGKQ